MAAKPFNPTVARNAYAYNPETGQITRARNMGFSGRYKIGSTAGSKDGEGYLRVTVAGGTIKAHRLAFALMNKPVPDEVDHINGIRDDNRWANLRGVTRQENQQNASISRRNTSGVTGVGWDRAYGKWHAYIRVDKKLKKLGRFDSLLDAVAARKRADKEHGFHENHGKIMPNISKGCC